MPVVALPINGKLLLNVSETALVKGNAALENAYANDTGGIVRFPGFQAFSSLPAAAGTRVFLFDWKEDLIAATSQGRLYRIDRTGRAEDVTGTPLSGAGRPVFSKTDDEMLVAAGGPILKFAGAETSALSADAPDSTHVGYIDGYTVAIESRSGRFRASAPGASSAWDPLDVFTAEGKPDDLNALYVTSFREMLLTGTDSVEQFETSPSGDKPFTRRWASGETVYAPYTLVEADRAVYFLNSRREFVRLSGQAGVPRSDDIGRSLSEIEDWAEAWASELLISGQKFILLSIPRALAPTGLVGLTLLYDYRSGRWATLAGWDTSLSVPGRYPIWSVRHLWGRVFLGGENGKIWELKRGVYSNGGVTQRVLYRSGHLEARALVGADACGIDDLRLRLERGSDINAGGAAVYQLRVRKDNGRWSKWAVREIGRPGDSEMHVNFGRFGIAQAFQLELTMTDNGNFDAVRLEADLSRVSR